MSDLEATVQLFHVRKRFGGRRDSHLAVDDVSLLVDRTSRMGIVGESGSGKSTVVRMLVGLEAPTEGSAEFRGRPIHSLSRSERRDFRRAVQLVAQDTSSSFDPRRTLRDAVRRPAQELRGVDARAADLLVDETLLRLGLEPSLADRKPRQVSGGQRQRFSIARALIVEPQVIVCDEVVSALDVSIQGSILNLLKRYCEEQGAGLVFVSHGLPATAFLADCLVVMHQGRVVEEGPTDDVLHHSSHPYTASLVAAHEGPDETDAPTADLLPA